MSRDRQEILTTACLLILAISQTNGLKTRKSRSINDQASQPTVRTYRPNSIDIGDRNYDHRHGNYENSIVSNYDVRSRSLQPTSVISSTSGTRKFHNHDEEKLFAVINSKEYRTSTPAEIVKFDRIGELMIARANITEEAKRVVRQVKRQRPGFFWTLARVAFETVNETRSAIEQISELVQSNFEPDTTTSRGRTTSLMSDATTTQRMSTTMDNGESAESIESTTTEKPFKFTRNDFQTIIRRNIKGLIRLFNIEWRDALNQSQTNIRDFQRDLGNQISPFLQDNPDVV